MKKLSKEQRESLFKDYLSGMNIKNIGEKYNLSPVYIRHLCSAYQIKRFQSRREEVKKIILENNWQNKPVRTLSSMLKADRDMINKILSEIKENDYTVLRNNEENQDAEALWNTFAELSGKYKNSIESEKSDVIKFHRNKIIGIAFISDAHIGNDGCNYKKMKEDAEIVANTPNLYAVLGGDLMDNHILIQEAMMASNTSPKMQWKLLKYYIDIFRQKILVAISGNHEFWTKRVSGLDLLENYFQGLKILYGTHSFLLRIEFQNGYKTVIKIRHKYRYNSMDNLTHTVKKMLKEGRDDFDVGIVAHHHQAEITKFVYKNKERIAIRTGSYLLYDTYAEREGFENSTNNMPSIIINPFTKKIDYFWDIKDVAEVLKLYNKNGG